MKARAALVAAVYLAGAVVLTWPLATDPAGFVAGGARTDAFNALWSLWFVAEGLARGELPVSTVLLDHPTGGRLVVADPLNALIGAPLVLGADEVVAYAALVIGHLAFAGIAAHALGRRLGGSGWIAGLGYQWAPILLSHVHNGSSEAVSGGWLPLAVLAVIDVVEKGGGGRAAWAGVALALVALGGWYAGVGAFLFAGMVLVVGWPNVSRRDVLTRLAPALAIGLLLVAPLAAGVRAVAQAPDGLVDIKNPDDLGRIRRTLGAADPRTFFAPGDFRSPDFSKDEANPNDRVHTAYLGWVLIALALWKGRRQPAALWATLLGGMVLALGPVVVVDGFPFSVAGRALPLPYTLLERLPGFNSLSLLYRLATVSALVLAVLADRARPAFAALVVAEVALASPARHLPDITPVPDMPAVESLAPLPEGAVINLPVLAGRNFLYEQVHHEKPIAGSLNSGANRSALRVLHAARLLRKTEIPKEGFVAIAQEEGIRYVVWHKNLLMAETFVASNAGIKGHFTPLAEDERVVIYQLW